MKIMGAVLEEIGLSRPYSQSKPIRIRALELEGPGPGEILVKIEAAGLCHSDLSVVNGNRDRPVPMLLGHEAAGKVVALGEGVDDIAPGQRVVMSFLPRCGECANCDTDGRLPCTPGSVANGAGELLGGGRRLRGEHGTVHHHLGVSAFADHAVVDRRSVVPIDDDVPPQIAAVLGCAVLTGGGALINTGNPQAGDTVIVVGLGGVGMAALITAISLGKGMVIGIDAVPAKLEHALKLGATAVYTPSDAIAAGVKASVVIEAAGNSRAFETAVAVTGIGGTTVTVGLPSPKDTVTISPLGLTAEARVIVGSYLGSAVPSRDIPKFAQMWREGRLPVEELISSTISLHDINSAMDHLADGSAIRQIILFEEAEES
ncbi:alcohol dehydrogenase catalytic domain-containing protein [Nocardia salmonicida]|uniref:alcohol dehydrogenase catalytic domain-containing protein n=1 Tax=Nocardia salmonicida TaxID=53431 RepID=UPI0033F77909